MTVVLYMSLSSIFRTPFSMIFFHFHCLTWSFTFVFKFLNVFSFVAEGLLSIIALGFLWRWRIFLTSPGRPFTWFFLFCHKGSEAYPIFALNSSAIGWLWSLLTSTFPGISWRRFALNGVIITSAITRLWSEPTSSGIQVVLIYYNEVNHVLELHTWWGLCYFTELRMLEVSVAHSSLWSKQNSNIFFPLTLMFPILCLPSAGSMTSSLYLS